MSKWRLIAVSILVSAGLVLSGCATADPEAQALRDLSSQLQDVRTAIGYAAWQGDLEADFSVQLEPIAADIRDPDSEESRDFGGVGLGYYALEEFFAEGETDARFHLDLLAESSVHTGGFAPDDLSYFTCVQLSGQRGHDAVALSAEDCPDWLVDLYHFDPQRELSSNDLDL